MIKNLLITYLFTVSSVMAGLPPTTIKNQNAASKTVNFNLELPNNQSVPTAASTALITTGNKDELQNSNFEHSTVTTGWTVSNATASGNTANPLEGKKSLSLALTGALSLSQSSTINAAQKSGVQMVASIWVNSSDVSDLQLCSLKNGVEDKCTVTGGYVQGSGWRQLTVSFLGDSTSNGLKLKSTDTTGTVLVDQAYVGIGSPIVDFTPDMEYTAQVSSTGVVSGENTDWLNGNCSAAGSRITCTYISGLVTVPMNCVATPMTAGIVNDTILGYAAGNTSSGFAFDGGAAARAFSVVCQKQGADYKTSKAYVASSSDFGYTNAGAITITATTTNPTKGTVVTDRVFASRDGQRLKAIYQYDQTTGGTAGSGEYLFSLPSGLSFDSSFVGFYTGAQFGASENKAIIGWGKINTGSNASTFVSLVAYDSTRFRVYAVDSTSVRGYIGSAFYALSGAVGLVFNLDAPIQGWSDSGVIVGSFQGYNETPGTSRVETFSVVFGTTNKDTPCTASPCSYISQIGNAVTNITRSGTGLYKLNLSKTYSKANCTIDARCASVSGGTVACIRPGSILSCENCNSLSFAGANTGITVNEDIAGTIICQGIPQ